VLDVSWDAFAKNKDQGSHNVTIHQITGQMTDSIIKQSAIEKSCENLTIVMISFKNLETTFKDYIID
jgi:hypothetical protein